MKHETLFCLRSIILTSYVSRRRANQKAIERLKDMLVMVSYRNKNYPPPNPSQKNLIQINLSWGEKR